jgi:hypothetical protein
VICNCQVHGCGAKAGIMVDLCTMKAHQCDDHMVFAREAHATLKCIMLAQEGDIAAYLASMTLSDKISNTSKHQGGRMWARDSPDDKDLQTMTDNFTPTPPEPPSPSISPSTPHRPAEPLQRSVTSALIKCLSEIDASAELLAQKASESLSCLEYPLGNTHTPFPLQGLLTTCRSVDDDLNHIRSKVPAVVEFQHSIKEKLDKVCDTIVQAQC